MEKREKKVSQNVMPGPPNSCCSGWSPPRGPQLVNVRLFFSACGGGFVGSVFLVRWPVAGLHYEVTCACPPFNPYP